MHLDKLTKKFKKNRYKLRTRIIMGDTGNMITEDKQIIRHFKEHFKCLLN